MPIGPYWMKSSDVIGTCILRLQDACAKGESKRRLGKDRYLITDLLKSRTPATGSTSCGILARDWRSYKCMPIYVCFYTFTIEEPLARTKLGRLTSLL